MFYRGTGSREPGNGTGQIHRVGTCHHLRQRNRRTDDCATCTRAQTGRRGHRPRLYVHRARGMRHEARRNPEICGHRRGNFANRPGKRRIVDWRKDARDYRCEPVRAVRPLSRNPEGRQSTRTVADRGCSTVIWRQAEWRIRLYVRGHFHYEFLPRKTAWLLRRRRGPVYAKRRPSPEDSPYREPREPHEIRSRNLRDEQQARRDSGGSTPSEAPPPGRRTESAPRERMQVRRIFRGIQQHRQRERRFRQSF